MRKRLSQGDIVERFSSHRKFGETTKVRTLTRFERRKAVHFTEKGTEMEKSMSKKGERGQEERRKQSRKRRKKEGAVKFPSSGKKRSNRGGDRPKKEEGE